MNISGRTNRDIVLRHRVFVRSLPIPISVQLRKLKFLLRAYSCFRCWNTCDSKSRLRKVLRYFIEAIRTESALKIYYESAANALRKRSFERSVHCVRQISIAFTACSLADKCAQPETNQTNSRAGGNVQSPFCASRKIRTTPGRTARLGSDSISKERNEFRRLLAHARSFAWPVQLAKNEMNQKVGVKRAYKKRIL